MRLWPLLLLALPSMGCELVAALECPQGPLDEGDLPCTCQGAIAENLSCGTLTCTEFGLEAGTGECDSSKTYDTATGGS